MMVVKSPRGGKILSGIWASAMSIKNLLIKPSKEAQVVDDFYVWKIGYADREIKRGEPVYIKKSDAKRLYEVLRYYA